MSNKSTEQIVARLKNDDRSVLKEIFQDHYSGVCAAIYRFIKDRNLVEDLAQEVFLRFWNKRHQITVKSSIGAYLSRMAINEALGHIRKHKKFEQEEFQSNMISGSEGSGEDHYLYGELGDQIKKSISTLPPRCRTIFEMSRYDEMTYAEIAKTLDISIKTVENQMGKALKILRSQLVHYIRLVAPFLVSLLKWLMN